MENDYLVNIYKMYYTNDVMGLSPNHVFSSKNDNNYYISMNFNMFVNPSNSRNFNKNSKL